MSCPYRARRGDRFDEEQAAKLEKKFRSRSFDLEDFAQQLDQVTKMGPLDQLLDMMPGMSQLKQAGPIEIDPKRHRPHARHPLFDDESKSATIRRSSAAAVAGASPRAVARRFRK